MNDRLNGFFAIGIHHPKTGVNIGTLIRSAVAFGANFVFTIGARYQGQRSAVKTDRHMPIIHFSDFSSWQKDFVYNAEVVAIEILDGAPSLATFKHPKRAIYLLGSEDKGLDREILKLFTVVQIPGRYCLNVATAGSIVMYDRICKQEAGINGKR